MYFDFLVKIPENTGKISLNKRGGTTYIEYTYGRRYTREEIQRPETNNNWENGSIRFFDDVSQSELPEVFP